MQYSTDQKALIALAEAEVPARRGYDIWEFFESGDDFFAEAQTSDFVRKKLGTLYDTAISKLTVAYVDEIIAQMDNLGVRVTTMLDDDFPAVLRDMLCPPYLLYYRGDLSLCDTQGIAQIYRLRRSRRQNIQQSFSNAFYNCKWVSVRHRQYRTSYGP